MYPRECHGRAYGHAKLELVGMSCASSNGHKYAYYWREYPNTTVNALFCRSRCLLVGLLALHVNSNCKYQHI